MRLEGMSYQRIGRALGISPITAQKVYDSQPVKRSCIDFAKIYPQALKLISSGMTLDEAAHLVNLPCAILAEYHRWMLPNLPQSEENIMDPCDQRFLEWFKALPESHPVKLAKSRICAANLQKMRDNCEFL